jgi:hypothetical protein
VGVDFIFGCGEGVKFHIEMIDSTHDRGIFTHNQVSDTITTDI